MDDIDRANIYNETMLEKQLKSMAVKMTRINENPEFCVECNQPIPEKRRALSWYVDKCVYCAEVADR